MLPLLLKVLVKKMKPHNLFQSKCKIAHLSQLSEEFTACFICKQFEEVFYINSNTCVSRGDRYATTRLSTTEQGCANRVYDGLEWLSMCCGPRSTYGQQENMTTHLHTEPFSPKLCLRHLYVIYCRSNMIYQEIIGYG